MAELTPKELLQPSLLDRLTDEDPSNQQESRYQRVLSPARLRETVRRDLAWLLNTTNLSATEHDLAKFPDVENSVLNYGMPDLNGRTVSSIDVPALEELLRKTVWDFEPRLLRDTVKISLVVDNQEMNQKAMTFSIEAMLWAQPTPLRLFFRTEIDLESGQVSVNEWGPAGRP